MCKLFLARFWERRGSLWDAHFPMLSIIEAIKSLSKPYVLKAIFSNKKHLRFYNYLVSLLPVKNTNFMSHLYTVWSASVILGGLFQILRTYKTTKFNFHWRWEPKQIKELIFFVCINFIARMSVPFWTVYFFPNNRIPEILYATMLGVSYALVDSFELYIKQNIENDRVEVPIWGLILSFGSVLLLIAVMYPLLYSKFV